MKDYIIKTENLGFTYNDSDDNFSRDIPALSNVSIGDRKSTRLNSSHVT